MAVIDKSKCGRLWILAVCLLTGCETGGMLSVTSRGIYTISQSGPPGTTSLQPLYVSKSGEYVVQLTAEGTLQDSFRFWVTRNSTSLLGTMQRLK